MSKKSKQPQTTRIYPIGISANKVVYVEAPTAAAAVVHAFKPTIGRPLSGSQVNDLHRQGIKIEVANAAQAELPA